VLASGADRHRPGRCAFAGRRSVIRRECRLSRDRRSGLPGGPDCPASEAASSAAVTSARHSSRPPRIRRNSSCPGWVSEPTVALRAEMMPSSGAMTAALDAPQLGRCQTGPGGVQACQRRIGGGLRLDTRLRAVETLFAKLPGALVDRSRLGQCRRGFGNCCPALGEFAVDRVAGDAGQHFALSDRIADIGVHLGNPVVADLRADDGFLPGGHVAAGGERLWPGKQFRGDDRA
jgi:hypothetical protein